MKNVLLAGIILFFGATASIEAQNVGVPYSLHIKKIHNSVYGRHEFVDVSLTGGSGRLGGFDLTVAYDDTDLDLIGATPGNTFYGDLSCKWEYFTYKHASPGNCGSGICDFGRVRVTGIAETNNGNVHPACFISDSLPAVLFTLEFLAGVGDPCHSSCEFYPIRFVWLDCDNNTLSNPRGDSAWISRNVYDFDFTNLNIADSTGNIYPTFKGAQLCAVDTSCGQRRVRFVDFYNGGIDMVCADSIDARGDLNLNNIAYEAVDAKLFVDYFMNGLSVFRVNLQGQIAASNVNGDTTALSVADLVFLINGIMASSVPCPIVAPPTLEAQYSVCNGAVSIDEPIGAAFLLAQGEVTPTLLAANKKMVYRFDGENTRILIYTDPSSDSIKLFQGNFVSDIGTLVSAEFGSPEGGTVIAHRDSVDCDTMQFKVRIEKTHGTIMGQHEFIDVTLDAGSEPFGGFSFTIAYDDSFLHLLDVKSGDALGVSGCNWEYFGYRSVHSGSGCNGGTCDFGRVQIGGIAETNNGDVHPACFLPQLPAVLFTLDFQVGDNRCQGNCRFFPLEFVWLDCGDNTINLLGDYDPTSDTFFISHTVFDYNRMSITDSTVNVYPSRTGTQICHNPNPAALNPIRKIDFYNGGIDIICADELDIRGDMNLNEVQFEPEDVDLFVEYFLHGLSVFHVNVQGQVATSDVNNDSLTLTVADLAYMSSVIRNNIDYPSNACGILPPPSIEATYSVCDGIVSVDAPVGAAFLVAEGNVEPKLLPKKMVMRYFFDGENTRILIYPDTNATTVYPFDGAFVSGIGNLLSAEFGTLAGGSVHSELEVPCDTTPFKVSIEKAHNAIQGQHEFVNIVLERGTQQLGGFDFLISYDTLALQLADVKPGPDWFDHTVDSIGCEWEYFTYRLYHSGCTNTCPKGTVRVVALAETNVCCHHPNCFMQDSLPSVLFTLDFLVSSDRKYEDQFLPLRFIWFDCGDNGLTNPAGNEYYISRNVYNFDSPANIADSNGTYPTWHGAQICHDPHPDRIDLIRKIDFVNGGIEVTGYDSGDFSGDVNLNGIRSELSDAVLFANYFQYGPRVFTINQNGQTAATDINHDGLALTLSDLVYLEGIIAGILPDGPKHIPPTISAKYTIDVGKVSVDTTVAAAFLIAKGHVVPTLLASNMDMTCHFDSSTTRILIYTDPHRYTIRSFTGAFVDGIDSLISIEFATPQGGMVEVQRDTMIQALNSYSVRIERTRDTYQGGSQSVDVILEKGRQPLGGFDFLMAYETNALLLTSVTPGTDWVGAGTGCEWEYFTYRYSEFGTCGSACASGKVRVVALADLNSQPDHHPLCGIPSELPSTLFTLNFRVSDNRTFECAFLPVRFVWFDRNDNLLYNPSGDTMFISRTVVDSADAVNIADSLDSYPTFKGAQRCNAILPQRYHPIRGIDFKNGGIQIGCDWMLESRGDLNLNEISNEIADVAMFCDYFIHGLGAFKVNVQGQIAMSDVNYDDKPLTVADLVYECRVVIGDANPYPKSTPPTMEAHYTVANGKISIDSLVAAAVIDVQGDVVPTLLARNMNMLFSFDGTNTHILVYTDPSRLSLETFCGTFLSVTGTVLSAEFATPQGGMVTASRIESGLQDFILGQNYPNPFNLTTRISFSLPAAATYTLAIYNIAGQKVYETSNLGVAGINAIDWTASHEASGIYFYKLTSGNISETKKMIFLK